MDRVRELRRQPGWCSGSLAHRSLISRTGSYAPGFVLAAIVLLVGIICYWFIVGDLRPNQSELRN